MLTKEDFMELDGRYYVGNIIEVDGGGWVSEEELVEILEIANKEEYAISE